MTNAEKYLTVSIKEFFSAIIKSKIDISGLYSFEKWLLDEAKPTLTEDERVILRNIGKGYERIGRYDKTIMVFDIDDIHEELDAFSHLFQFIKERRRIFY